MPNSHVLRTTINTCVVKLTVRCQPWTIASRHCNEVTGGMLVRLHNLAAITLHRNSINSQSVRTLQPRNKPMLPPISPGIQHATKRKTKPNKKYRQISWLDHDKLELSLYVLYYLSKGTFNQNVFSGRSSCARCLFYFTFTTKVKEGKERKIKIKDKYKIEPQHVHAWTNLNKA